MWSNSKLNSFTKSFTSSSSSSSSKSAMTGGESLKKADKTSLAKTISNNFSSLSNYSLSLAVGNSSNNSNNKNSEKSQVKDQSRLDDVKEENMSNKEIYRIE